MILESLNYNKTYYFLQFVLAAFDDLNRGFQKDSEFEVHHDCSVRAMQ